MATDIALTFFAGNTNINTPEDVAGSDALHHSHREEDCKVSREEKRSCALRVVIGCIECKKERRIER